MGLLFDIIPDLAEEGEERFVSPENLQIYVNYEDDLNESVRMVSRAITVVLQEIGCSSGITKIRNIRQTLVVQQEIIDRLLDTYKKVFQLFRRMEQLLSSEMFSEENGVIIRNRVEAVVDEQLFQTQREVFFKIVNAQMVAEGEKNIDGPALLFPGIEKTKNQIINQIERQNKELGPVAVNLCKGFQGIADNYIDTEELVNERERYDSIYQTFGQEKKIRTHYLKDISPNRLEDEHYIETLIGAFEELKVVYREKSDSLRHIADSMSIEQYKRKSNILDRGQDQVDERLKPLRVLKQMSKDFPRLVKQLDFFADSHYQARAVFRVLEEIREEMGHVFRRYDLDAITVVSFLKYKLNGVSHMYESIHYYYAATRIEADMHQALMARPGTAEDSRITADYQMEVSGIPAMVRDMHQHVALMNRENYRIHRLFIEFKENRDLQILKAGLREKTQKINRLFKQMKTIYTKAQSVFAGFLLEDLGATGLESQLNESLKQENEMPEADSIRKSLKILLASKQKTLATLEKQVLEQADGELGREQASAVASLKVKKDFMKELKNNIQPYPVAQEVFLEMLKEFIQLRDNEEQQNLNGQSILWIIENNAGNAFDQYKVERELQSGKTAQDGNRSERELAIDFISTNITPQEVESFSRMLPVLPRNELHLDTSSGRLLLEIIHKYKESLQSRGGSGSHLIERIYEKRERLRLISSICVLFQEVAERFYARIRKEESKSNHLISLQRMKYRKELGEVIKYWQYLIMEQIEPGQGQRGRFRRYSKDEQKLIMKAISPEQLELIDRQLTAGFDLETDDKLQEVERFLLEIVDGLFSLFERDERIRSEFEAFALNKKFRYQSASHNTEEDILSSMQFMPNIRSRLDGNR